MTKRLRVVLIAVLSALMLLSAGLIIGNNIKAKADDLTPILTNYAKNLSFNDSVYVMYAIKTENVQATDELGMLVWTEVPEKYEIGTQKTVLKPNYQNVNGTVMPVFTYPLAAKQMADTLYTVAYAKRGDSYYYSAPRKYSVIEYAYNKLGKTEATPTTNEELIELLADMLNYGGSAQKYFDYAEERLAREPHSYVKIDGVTFYDGYDYIIAPMGSTVEIFIKDGYRVADVYANYIKEEDGKTYLTIPTLEEDENDTTIKQDSFNYEEFGLPILRLDGDFTGISKDNKVKLQYEYQGEKGSCTLKWQGSSSLKWEKKNYTIKFEDEVVLKEEWGAQDKYCIKANYIDYSQARNICSANLWSQMVGLRRTLKESVYNKAESITGGKILKDDEILNILEKAPNNGAIDGYPLLLVINGEYSGLYSMNVPKDGWMFGMYDSENEAGEYNGVKGAIVCAEGVLGGASDFKSSINLFGKDPTKPQGFELEYCSEEFSEEEIEASLKRLIDTCIAVSEGKVDISALDPYLDWTSVIDYVLFSLMTGNFDGLTKNYLLATYDGVKWFFSAYDMDSTFGLWWDGTKYVMPTQTTRVAGMKSSNLMFKVVLEDVNKIKILQRRYVELTQWTTSHPMHEDQVYTVFSNYINQIHKLIYEEECKIWKSIPLTSTNNLSQISDWYHKRVSVLKTDIESLK